MKTTVIFGATSGIAEAYARILAARSEKLILVARNRAKVEAIATDLKLRGASDVRVEVSDLDLTEEHPALVRRIFSQSQGVDQVLIAQGVLDDQQESERSWASAQKSLLTNFLGPASLLTELATAFEVQGSGTLAVISSVAGDRGRASNYVYGSAKAGLSAFTSGLRQRLWRRGIRVITLKPGFVDTPMTAAFRKGLLWASPATVARGMDRALQHSKPVAYLPGFWRAIMWVIRSIPERMFVRVRI